MDNILQQPSLAIRRNICGGKKIPPEPNPSFYNILICPSGTSVWMSLGWCWSGPYQWIIRLPSCRVMYCLRSSINFCNKCQVESIKSVHSISFSYSPTKQWAHYFASVNFFADLSNSHLFMSGQIKSRTCSADDYIVLVVLWGINHTLSSA